MTKGERVRGNQIIHISRLIHFINYFHHCLSFRMGTSCLLSSIFMASAKEARSLPIYSSFAWKSSPQLSTAPSMQVLGIPSKSPLTDLIYLTFSLQMMSSSSPSQKILNFGSSQICLVVSVRSLG